MSKDKKSARKFPFVEMNDLLHKTPKFYILSVAVALLATSGSIMIGHGGSLNPLSYVFSPSNQERVPELSDSAHKQQKATKEESEPKKSTPASTAKAPATKLPAEPTDKPVLKYSTSSDPRSTAYSTTPPKPNPKSINIKITHNGQVKPGTVIEYNPTKDAGKVYYGGDLVFSEPVISVNRNSPYASFKVSIPGGATADSIPSTPWYDYSDRVFASYNGYAGPGSTWTMQLDFGYPTPAIGTYRVHLHAQHQVSTFVDKAYDGFLTVNLMNF